MREALDLCCGMGGWSDELANVGYVVTGVDTIRHPLYHHRFIPYDVRRLSPDLCGHPDIIVASPPCSEFSRLDMPWTRRTSPAPDLSILHACLVLIRTLKPRLWVLENVRGMQRWYMPATFRSGSHYLWGDVALAAASQRHHDHVHRSPEHRAKIPRPLAQAIAQVAWASGPAKQKPPGR